MPDYVLCRFEMGLVQMFQHICLWNEALTMDFFSSDSPRKEVYFMAVIDILQHYDAKKKAAHAAKTVKHGVSSFD